MSVLTKAVKERGLLVGSFGDANRDQSNVTKQLAFGVDVVICNGILKYYGTDQ
jgi:glycerophosphoryl diester phosphodiesterase